MAFYDVTTNGGTTTLGNAMAIGHNLTVAGGTLTTSASNFGLTIGGDVTVGATFRWNGSAVAIARQPDEQRDDRRREPAR